MAREGGGFIGVKAKDRRELTCPSPEPVEGALGRCELGERVLTSLYALLSQYLLSLLTRLPFPGGTLHFSTVERTLESLSEFLKCFKLQKLLALTSLQTWSLHPFFLTQLDSDVIEQVYTYE